MIGYLWFSITLTQSTEEVWTTYLRHLPWSYLVAPKGFTVHSWGPHSRQDQAQNILNDCQSNHEKYESNQGPKYFKIHPSEPRNIENFGGGSIDYQKITKDK